ncbi:MAG: CHC2 zinc finger domain-containing protein [Peptostreptococcaceae bacterium]
MHNQLINYYYPNQLRKNKMKCPFHNDKSPSLHIADKGNGAFYKCFGCQSVGGIIDFIKRVENIEFIEALKKAYHTK